MPADNEPKDIKIDLEQSHSLDEVHAQAIHQLDEELLGEKEVDESEEVEEVEEIEEIEEVEEVEEVEEDEPEPVVVPEPVKAVEVNTDITEKGEGKIAMRNSDGETIYVNNVDEIPDDFEPSSYKDFAVATQRLNDKAIDDRAIAAKTAADTAQAQRDAEINTVTASWDKDIDTLTKGGVLSKDQKERDVEIGNVYEYIAKNLTDGVVIDSFAQALKSLRYENLQAEQQATKDAKAQETKDKGSVVMGGGGTNPTKPVARVPLPAGLTLDQVHERFSGL